MVGSASTSFLVERTGEHSVKIRKVVLETARLGHHQHSLASSSFGIPPQPPSFFQGLSDGPPPAPPKLAVMHSLLGGGIGAPTGNPSIPADVSWDRSFSGFFSNTSLDINVKIEHNKMATWQAKLIHRISSFLAPTERCCYSMACKKFYTLLSTTGTTFSSKPTTLTGTSSEGGLPSLMNSANPASSPSKEPRRKAMAGITAFTQATLHSGYPPDMPSAPPSFVKPLLMRSDTDLPPPNVTPTLKVQHSLLGGGIQHPPTKLDLRHFQWKGPS